MSEEEAEDVALSVRADVRSVMRRLLGWPVRGHLAEAIDAEIEARRPKAGKSAKPAKAARP